MHFRDHSTYKALKRALPKREIGAIDAWLSCFYPFQVEWLLDWDRFSLLLKSRQIGASHTYGAAGVLWSFFGDTTTIVSTGEREARIVLDKAHKHAKVLAALGSEWAQSRATTTELKLASGGQVIALPASSGGRGFSGNIILDEFAYHDAPDKIWDGASGSVMLGFKLRVCSTPNGVGNLFHHLWTDDAAHAGYKLHNVSIDDAIAQKYPADLAECWKIARGDPRVFDQLFRCKFLDNNLQYIPSELIASATTEETAPWDGESFGGLDIGRKNHLTSLAIVKRDDDACHWTQAVETRAPVKGQEVHTEESDLDALLALAFGTYGCRRVCIDATGIGAFPATALQKKWGRQRVELVTFTNDSKEDLATTLYQRLADKKLKLPRSGTNAKELRDDLASLRRIITSAGNVRYDAPTTDRGHADRAWALALALHGCSKPINARFEDYA